MVVNVDLRQIVTFLTVLDKEYGAGARFVFGTVDDNHERNDYRMATRLHGDLDGAVRLTGPKKGQLCSTIGMLTFMQSKGAGAFIAPQVFDGTGATAKNVTGIRVAITDADSDEQLESQRRFIVQSGVEPSVVVASGGLTASGAEKLQFYWKLSDCPVDRFTALQLLLISRAGTDPSVKDPPRLMRLPGFPHQKREPRTTRIVAITDRIYDCRSFMQRVQAQPQVCDPRPASTAGGNSNRGTRPGGRQHGQAHQDALGGRTPRLRELLDRYGGLITPAVHTLLREAQAPGEGTPGNRHATLVTIVARLVHTRWGDDDIRQLVLPVVNAGWGDGSWDEHLARITAWVREREAAAEAAQVTLGPAPAHIARDGGLGLNAATVRESA